MRVMVIVPGSEQSERGELPPEKVVADMQKYNEDLAQAGVLLAGEGLHPTSKDAVVRFPGGSLRVRFEGGKRTVIDGPFTESKELIAGFWLLQVRSLDEAIEWVKRAPFGGGIEIEIRPIFEVDEFHEQAHISPELREREKRLWEQVQARKS